MYMQLKHTRFFGGKPHSPYAECSPTVILTKAFVRFVVNPCDVPNGTANSNSYGSMDSAQCTPSIISVAVCDAIV